MRAAPLGARFAPLLALALLAGAEAGAHGRSTSTSAWRLDEGGARVRVRVQLSDLQRTLPELGGVTAERLVGDPRLRGLAQDYLGARLTLASGSSPCLRDGEVTLVPSADPTHLSWSWRLRCEPGPRSLRIDPFLEVLPSHLHLARIETAAGEVVERVFVLDAETWRVGGELASPAAAASSLADYFRLGVEHIATGFDHLLFLLALLLVGVSVAEVATVVTGFTVAHSVTLALGVLGWVEPRPAAIESLIGLSIAVVAVENFALTGGPGVRRDVLALLAGGTALAGLAALAGAVAVPATALLGVGLFSLCYLGLLERSERPARLRWFVALVFGLVHGFGFAGLLTEIGLPRDRLVPALLGFNLGVEVGQLVLVVAAWPLLRLVVKGPATRRALVVQLGSTPILVAGLYWFLTRAVG